jgi:catechol 2,3-dioxygenase-like lactoylglutathione lyase family enzyme
MDYKLEAVIVPVTDVDRAKAFYSEQAGFAVDVDHGGSDTPNPAPHAACTSSSPTSWRHMTSWSRARSR